MSSDPHSNIYNENQTTVIIAEDITPQTEISYFIKEKAVWRALFANLGIASIKFICWMFSKSSAMLSESIHSAADAFNSICLIIGLKRGRRPADNFHPFGYGLEANIWALFASGFLLIGTAISLYNGGNNLLYHTNHTQELLDNYNLIAITLIASIMFEIWAVLSASHAVTDEAEITTNGNIDAFFKSLKYIGQIKSPTTKFVWYEDTAALAGVIIALIALTISKFFVDVSYAHIPDAIASIIIGFLLLGLAIYLLRYNVNFLTGASAKPDIEENIKEIANTTSGISRVIGLKTMDMGHSGLIINLEIEVNPEIQVKDADDIADKLEAKLKEKIKNISHITIEVQANDIEEDWREKFDKVIDEGKQNDILNPTEAKMLSRFFDFTETVAYEIMVPRIDVNFISADAKIDELIDLIISSGHTRIPVYEEDIDDILGIVNAKDVLKVLKNCEDKNNIDIRNLTREVNIIPENKSISSLLNDFIVQKAQMAIVVDEHGGVAGIVTIEDILEEIVGEIWDEYDVQIPEVIQIDEKTLNVLSKMNIYDLNERFNLDLPTEDFQTVGGLIFGQLGREPEIGDEIKSSDITMKVESMDGHKIVGANLYREDGFIDSHNINVD
ncbi:MAG: hypothetical protein A2Y25_01730 [Candidatus Melainabacteria bacterium GWF2_37_15]|nr:MAG: hypothetical protein A2Y25_01730 [Candidatus Melainabacteria bacterium GWF2_37_15]